jgi:hypothetical protein
LIIFPAPEEVVDICRLSPLKENTTNQCLAFLIRWTFNSTEGKCQQYIYGGCQGSANLFMTEEDCQAVCHKNGLQAKSDDEPAIDAHGSTSTGNLPAQEKSINSWTLLARNENHLRK